MDLSELTQLGSVSEIPESPDRAVIEIVNNPYPQLPYTCRFTCPEMTSLCPRTGAPDFATIVIDYQPKEFLIESKSLKLFIASFRNHRGFHEVCTVMICDRLYQAVSPCWIRVVGMWMPRGGIPIDVVIEVGCPEGDQLPPEMPIDLRAYRAR
jgi:7-cyano-7-deazaguanine reductase